jgi:hypothetical protein
MVEDFGKFNDWRQLIGAIFLFQRKPEQKE